MRTTSRLHTSVRIAALLTACLVTQAASAEDVVRMPGGGMVRGELMEVVPNQYVNIRLADGTARRIEWSQVESIEDDSAAPAPAEAQSAPPAPMVVGQAATTRVLTPEETARREALRAEIAQLELERGQLRVGGGVAMMVIGGASVLVVLPAVIGLWAMSEVCDTRFRNSDGTVTEVCENDGGLRTAGIVLTGIGAVGVVVGVIGLAQLLDVSSDRRSINEKIGVRQQQLNALSYDLSLGPQRAELTLRAQF